jgi:hypothetical protein
MLRWAATAAQREHAPAQPAAGPHDGARAQASRAALAANEAYRGGDLDQARQLTDQAAALDPSRAELWQQHRNEIAARRLILSARAAYTGNDPHRAEKLLQDARQLDPRLRAIWNGELSAPRPARPARQHAVTRGPGDTRDISRTVTPQAGPGSRAPVAAAHAGKGTAQPSWPSSPARVQPLPSAAGQQAGSTQPPAQHPVAAAPREPRAQSGITADGAGASAEPADRNPAARWPAPNPRTVQEASPPGQQARSTVTASPALAERRQAGAAADAEAAGKTSPGRPAAPSADWRDQIIREAREPWQPGPARRYDPAVAGSPEHQAAEPGIEPEA